MSEPAIDVDLLALADLGQPEKLAFELHRQLRAQFGSVPPRVPLAGIAKAVGIVGICEFDIESFEGTLVIRDGVGAIGLRQGLRAGRRNFTLGHEIGHFLIPAHRLQKSEFRCTKADMYRVRGSNFKKSPAPERIEVEANEFAAALLVPVQEFRQERRRLGSACDVGHVRNLAELFDVSQEMMAQKYVEVSDERIAIVTSHNGRVHRVIPCTGFPYLGLRKDAPVPPGSLTATEGAHPGNDSISEMREVETHIWLERRGCVTNLYEQVFRQDEGWAMTLLIVDEEATDEEEDDRNWNRRSERR
jgi:hypothetical protein